MHNSILGSGRTTTLAASARFGSRATKVCHPCQLFEESVTTCLRHNTEHFRLQSDRNVTRLLILPPAGWPELETVRSAVLLVRLAFEQASLLHPFEQRGNGVGVTG